LAYAAARLHAELPLPRLHLVTPMGQAAGTTREVTIEGSDLEGCERLWADHPGISATFVKERTFQLAVAPDVPVGTYDVWTAGRFGVTNPRVLQVTRGLVDIPEVEPNDTPSAAQRVALNSAIDGKVDGAPRDLYAITLKRGQRVTFELWSARLETEMDGLLTLYHPDGRQLASNADYHGRDPLIEVVIPADGEYVVEARDLTYRGGYPYRLWIHDQPRVEHVFPRAVQAGQPTTLLVTGSNLGAGAESTTAMIPSVPLMQRPWPYSPPTDLVPLALFRERVHTLQHSVAFSAATCTLVGEQVQPFGFEAIPILVTDQPTGVEQEPNEDQARAQPLTLPVFISGRFDQPRDADWYTFETDETGGAYGFDVYAERIDGHGDPYLAYYDDQGNRFLESDDFGHRVGSFDGHLRDPSGQTNLGPKQKFHVLVQDRYQRGGPRYHYVLQLRKATSDYHAAVIHHHTNPAGLTLWKGGATHLQVVLHHQDHGNRYPVRVDALDLPAGVHATPLWITANNQAHMVLWTDPDAPDFTGPIRLQATSNHEGREVTHVVRPFTRSHPGQGSRAMRQFPLAVREPAPYALRIEPERITATAGKPIELKLMATRYWPQFQGNIDVQPLNFPGPFQLSNATIAGGATELTLSIMVQPGTQAGDYTLSVLGQAQVPFHKDPAATDRPNTLVPLPSRPVTITVEAAKP
jgi:hypothetical protein